MARTVFITGASSGIGEATARAFAEEGYRLVITGRRHERLKVLKRELEADFAAEVLVLSFDIRARFQSEAAIESMPEDFADIDILVNNAGLAAGLERIDEGDPMDWNAMIDTNIKGLLYVTRVISDKMIQRGVGHIVNIGSIAGTQPYSKGGVYSGTKHAVHALSQAMRMDFLEFGIKVTEIRPGMAETEFSLVRFHGDKEAADDVYSGMIPLTGDDIAEAVLWAVEQPAHVNISEIVMTPQQQANVYCVTRKDKDLNEKQ